MQHPKFMQARRAVRHALSGLPDAPTASGLVLVGLSGGADSLALAAALAAETARGPWRGGAIVVDHGLQHDSAVVAERAAATARKLGLDPVIVRRVAVAGGGAGGRGAAARSARYEAFAEVAAAQDAAAVFTAHTRDDQAEQVLLALARGSGTRSVAGIPLSRTLAGHADASHASGVLLLRPFLLADTDVTRVVTEAACAELGLTPWVDPHNSDPGYARVRARVTVLPVFERELGPGIAAGLARSADLAREDAEALDAWAERVLTEQAAALTAETVAVEAAGEAEGELVALTLAAPAVVELRDLPRAVRQRVIHTLAKRHFGAQLTREHVLGVVALITDWRGQGPIHVPGLLVTRSAGALRFQAQRRADSDELS